MTPPVTAMRRPRILVADDEPTMRELFRETLERDWDVRVAEDGMRAKALLDHEPFDVAFLDLRMPGRDGAELLRLLRARPDRPRTVLMSAHAGAERQRELLAQGADHFLEKPFDPEAIEALVRALAAPAETPDVELIAEAPAIAAVLEIVARIAPTRATVLVQGETGTGKELLAREIHRKSLRAQRAFVRVNCAALAEGLLESELFGHERGSFTGAVRATRGLFQEADGGTLLLDEISEVSPALQAKLLRVLQEREMRKVGGGGAIAVDVRIIATTNRDLSREVAAGRFRADLFHRLNVVRIDVPPLRVRLEDLPRLAHAFLARKAQEHEIVRPSIDSAAFDKMRVHPWPGNVREMENALERAMLLAQDGRIRARDLELSPPAPPECETDWDGRSLEAIERSAILGALRAHRNNRTHAAEALGISVRTIRNKLHAYRDAGLTIEEAER